jgi:protease-4
LDKRAAVVLSVIFGGLFLALFGFMLLAYSAVRSASPLSLGDGDTGTTSVGARIGVIEVKGTIGDAQNGADGDKVVKLVRKYEKDDDIKAVLVRIDSPGGAVAPSQEVYSALRALRKKKKVVVSMGNLAASGGYYIASAADWIVANPGTLTGSIGVIFMHFNVKGLLEMAKVEETTLKSGKYKDTLSPFRPVQETDREEIQGISDDVYGQFIHDVAEGRGLKDEEVRPVAEGRIYTGRRAKELKLVDELGSFQDALNKAWSLSSQSGEPRYQLPGKDKELSLRDLMRGAFQGAAAGAAEGAMQGVRSGFFGGASAGPAFLAPALMQ